MTTGRSKFCPSLAEWSRLASGGLPESESSSLLAHAMECPACAEVLRSLTAIDIPVEGEEQLIAEMSILQPSGRRAIAASVANRRPGTRFRRSWWFAAAAALFATVGTAWFVLRQPAETPLELLASAYTARRQFELRIPSAAYAPLRIDKGGPSALGDLPAPLLDAELQTRRRLDRAPDDAAALHAKGRADLLTWRFSDALQSFQAAADLGADSADFLIDYATAYFLRAEKNDSPVDYSAALEKLGAALQKDPRQPAALFNRAIVRERLMQYEPAIRDLEQLLRIEKDAGWRREAESHIAGIRRKIGRVFGPDGPLRPPNAEAALETAMVTGLANAAPELVTWAGDLARLHREPWLQQTIALRDRYPHAIELLSALALLRSRASDSAEAPQWLAALATQDLPLPLAVWLGYESLYRTTRSRQVSHCDVAPALLAQAAPYPWFAAQLILESSLCAAGRQDFAVTEERMREAEQLSEQFDLRLTSLRCTGFRAQRLVDTGYYREAIKLARSALMAMESAGYPLRRAYDFHTVILRAATDIDRPHTAYGAATMMTAVCARTGMPVYEMIARSQAAAFAERLGNHDEAASQFQAASALAERLGDNHDAQHYWRQTRISLYAFTHNLPALRQLLSETTDLNTYFDRRLVAALCREELGTGNYAFVTQFTQEYWRRLTPPLSASPRVLRAYRDDLVDISRSAITAQLALGQPAAALATKLRMDDMDRRLMHSRAPAPSAPGVPVGTAVVIAEQLGERTAIWTQTATGLAFRWAGDSTVLSRLARRLLRLCSMTSVGESTILATARHLGSVLFADVSPHHTRIYVRAGQELGALPLSLFTVSRNTPGVLVTNLPYHERPLAGSSALSLHLFAASETSHDLLELVPIRHSIDREIASISEAFPRAITIKGKDATSRALDAAAQAPGVLHFSGHAIRWRDEIALVVAPDPADRDPDGRIGLWTLTPSRTFRSQLVVFSACGTATLGPRDSVTPDHLAQSVLLSGSEYVLAALWDVDAEATALWMSHFYRARQRGAAPLPAMDAANRALRDTPDWNHPRYWAAFSLYQRSIPDA